MTDALGSALSGLSNAARKIEASAANIARAGTDLGSDSDLVTDTVNIIAARSEYKANLITLKVSKDLSDQLGRLLDKEV